MRSLCCKFLAAVAVLLGVTCPHFAKAQSDPATLEKLVNSPEAQGSPTVPESEDSGPDRPAGTLVRPKDGVQHTDLDKAWAEYHETVSKAADGIKVAIKKQFDVTTAKGDLDAAEKWQAALEKFEKTGEVPLEDETKAAVNATASGYSRAKQGLSKAYEAMTKSLTKEKKITEAKAARAELRMLADTQSSRASVGETTPNKPQKQVPQRPKEIFLADLTEQNVSVGFGKFGTKGEMGFDDLKICVQGKKSPNGLSMHATKQGVSTVTYDVPQGYAGFLATAAMNDTAAGQGTPVVFKVFGDKNRLLWMSPPLSGAGQRADCAVVVKGNKTITLTVECGGSNQSAQSVWFEPRFLFK